MIYYLNINKLNKNELEKYLSYVPCGQNKAHLINKTKQISVLAQGYLRFLIGEKLHLNPCDISIALNNNGKPYLLNNELYFSIAHTNKMICIGISDKPIGVDIEKDRKVLPSMLKYLDEDELNYVDISSVDWAKRFLKLWTLKEAWIKCEGLRLENHQDINFIIRDNTIISNKAGYNFEFVEAPDNHVVSICEKL